MKTNYYKINNSLERINRGESTLFLDQKELMLVKSKLKKNSYNFYYPYKDSEKVVLYNKNIPSIKLYKIESLYELKHQEILGTIYSLGVDISYIGDIIKKDNVFYIYILEEMSKFIKNNLTLIANKKVKLKEIELEELEDYEREYESIEIIVSSLRIDNVLSSLINISRKQILEKIKEKEILINYEILVKNSYILKENDVFSVRKYGKYKYNSIKKNTKKDNYLIEILKYK